MAIFLDAMTLSPTSKQRKTVSTSSESPVPVPKQSQGSKKKWQETPTKMNHEPGKSLKIIRCLHSAINSFPMDKIQKKGDTFFPQQQKWRKVKPEGRRSGSNRSLLGRDPPRCPKGESRNPVIIRSIVEKLHPTKILMFCSGIFFLIA